MWRHEALLSFVDRIARDSEFREWYTTNPSEALASHGLRARELRDLEQVLAVERSQREVAEAMRPFVRLLAETANSTDGDGSADLTPELRFAQLTSEVGTLRARLAAAREAQRRRRPWWKFWE